jgi:hypothetical protein
MTLGPFAPAAEYATRRVTSDWIDLPDEMLVELVGVLRGRRLGILWGGRHAW